MSKRSKVVSILLNIKIFEISSHSQTSLIRHLSVAVFLYFGSGGCRIIEKEYKYFSVPVPDFYGRI